MFILNLISVFILGTIIGSFLNVLILRYNTGVSAIRGRSFCFTCGKQLSWSELVPVFSFLFQKGRCRGCRSKISWQYPLVEVVTGLLFMLVFLFQPSILVLGFITSAVLLAIAVYDVKHKIIPTGLAVTFGILAVSNIFIYHLDHWLSFILGGIILAAPFWLICFLSKQTWMGYGDPKLILAIGWFLGPAYGTSAVVLAFWLGALWSVILLIASKQHWFGVSVGRKTEVPFAPFLILGFLIAFFWPIDIFSLGLVL